ncbi:MAG TPA: hypothetical protein VD884_05005 [Ohtaekwangia sp.]|nr:hypothetical protein [Ohtaekwangia sp.]
MRKAFSFVIILSMTLHCASRLGVLSYLHKNRYTIGYSLGMISEIPIAMCNNEIDVHKSLFIQHHDLQDKVPAGFPLALEINLFEQTPESLSFNDDASIGNSGNTTYTLSGYPSPPLKFFQPPRV